MYTWASFDVDVCVSLCLALCLDKMYVLTNILRQQREREKCTVCIFSVVMSSHIISVDEHCKQRIHLSVLQSFFFYSYFIRLLWLEHMYYVKAYSLCNFVRKDCHPSPNGSQLHTYDWRTDKQSGSLFIDTLPLANQFNWLNVCVSNFSWSIFVWVLFFSFFFFECVPLFWEMDFNHESS